MFSDDVYRYLALSKPNQNQPHALTRPILWCISFIAAILSSVYYLLGSVPEALFAPLLLFSCIAAILAVVSYGFNFYYKTAELSFIENMIDFTLFGMQRLLSIYIPLIVLLLIGSTQTDATSDFYFVNIFAVWIGFGAIYGSIYAMKKRKIDFD